MAKGRTARHGGMDIFSETARMRDSQLLHVSGYAQPVINADRRETNGSAQKTAAVMRGMRILNDIVAAVLFAAVWWVFFNENTDGFDMEKSIAVNSAVYMGLVFWFGSVYNAYEIGICGVAETITAQHLVDFFSAVITYGLCCFVFSRMLNPLSILALILIEGVWNASWSVMATRIYFRIYTPPKTAILYRQEGDILKLERTDSFANKYDIQRYIREPRDIHHVIREIEGIQVVFVMGLDVALRNDIIHYCIENGILSLVEPQVGDVIMAGAKHMRAFSTPFLVACRDSSTPAYALIKRTFDIIGSFVGILITWPIMLITALAVKLYDGGPCLYKQVRLTRDRREFMIWKFRSMRADAERDGTARLTAQHDDRITPVGRIIRAKRLDELPQLFNILGGSMTFVGPRPERPEIAERYEQGLPDFSLRLKVKAGLTGYAQVYGRYNTEPIDKLRMDLKYINCMSLMEDVRLVIATAKVLFLKESTRGVDEGQTTAIHKKTERGKESA